MMYTITKIFEFEASHKLNLTYDSPCQNMHGHSYKVHVTISGDDLDENGMITDFSNLKPIKEWVMKHWDHATIIPETKYSDEVQTLCGKVSTLPYTNATAELMCKHLHHISCEKLKLPGHMITIRINETTNNYATYSEAKK